jgi:hypothetical protein
MRTVVTAYAAECVPAVKEFNRRMADGGFAEFRFPESPIPDWLPGEGDSRLFQEYLLVLEDCAVRGGYILKHQDFSLRGEILSLAHYRQPVSEGTWNRAYAGVAVQMLRAAMASQPLLFALGMGGTDRALPRMLAAVGWRLRAVPFYFKVLNTGRFLREIQPLRQSWGRRLAAELARATGAGWLAVRAAQGLASKRRRAVCDVEPFRGFSGWEDELWQRVYRDYELIAVRDSRVLNLLYPASNERFLGLKVSAGGRVAGWAVVLDTPMRDHRQFGCLRVGTIADCLAAPGDAARVTGAAAAFLEARGCDLLISNQAHGAWTNALGACGFLRGPSNFVFAAAKKLAGMLEPFDVNFRGIHLNRGDGDGPIHL